MSEALRDVVRETDGNTAREAGKTQRRICPLAGPRFPDAVKSPRNAANRSSDAANPSPDAANLSPDGANRSPDAANRSPDSANRSPDGANRSPDAANRSPDGSNRSPDGANCSPDAANRSPDGANRSPDGANRPPDGEDPARTRGGCLRGSSSAWRRGANGRRFRRDSPAAGSGARAGLLEGGVFREPDGTTARGWNDAEVDGSEFCTLPRPPVPGAVPALARCHGCAGGTVVPARHAALGADGILARHPAAEPARL